MLSKVKDWLSNQVNRQAHQNLHLPVLGLGRSLLALSLLLTLLCTDAAALFSTGLNPVTGEALFPLEKFNFFRLFDADNIVWAKWLAIGSMLLVIGGVLPQLTCILHWYMAYSFVNASLDIEGGDQICANMALLLIPICLFDNRFNHWHSPKAPTKPQRQLVNLFCNNWYWLIRLQVMVIYLHSATGKFVVDEWLNGTALYYWFNHPMFGMQPWLEPLVNPVVLNPYLAFLLTWGVMIFELYLSAAVLIDTKGYKNIFKAAVGFHFMIVLFHGLFSFFISMSGALALYLLVPWEMHKHRGQGAMPAMP